MLIIPIVCLLRTFNRYMPLSESLCSVSYVHPYVFQILEENLDDMISFRAWRLFCRWSPVVLDVFRSSQVIPRFNYANANENAVSLPRKRKKSAISISMKDLSMMILLMVKRFIVSHISILSTQLCNALNLV